jgi:hypothetical protein
MNANNITEIRNNSQNNLNLRDFQSTTNEETTEKATVLGKRKIHKIDHNYPETKKQKIKHSQQKTPTKKTKKIHKINLNSEITTDTDEEESSDSDSSYKTPEKTSPTLPCPKAPNRHGYGGNYRGDYGGKNEIENVKSDLEDYERDATIAAARKRISRHHSERDC